MHRGGRYGFCAGSSSCCSNQIKTAAGTFATSPSWAGTYDALGTEEHPSVRDYSFRLVCRSIRVLAKAPFHLMILFLLLTFLVLKSGRVGRVRDEARRDRTARRSSAAEYIDLYVL